jgi:hypothetical protein
MIVTHGSPGARAVANVVGMTPAIMLGGRSSEDGEGPGLTIPPSAPAGG